MLPPRPGPPSEDVLALGAIWASLLDWALLALLLVWAVDLWAPSQDLPWKPLQLSEKPGLATGIKFAKAADDPALCRQILRDGGVEFVSEPNRTEGFCTTLNAVRLRDGVTRLAPPAPVMTCPAALAYAFWERHAVQPAAQAVFGQRVVRVEHFGTYACRNVYGRREGRPSEHAFSNAVDVAAFRLADGRRVSVVSDFRDEGREGRFLRQVRDGACPWFKGVLSPDYNAAHRDHFHLDYGRYDICR